MNLLRTALALQKFIDTAKVPNSGNELQDRRELKKQCVREMLYLKFQAQALEEVRGRFDRDVWRWAWRSCGDMATGLLHEMEGKKIRLTDDECRTIFNIPDKVWRERDKRCIKPVDLVFVEKAGTAALCECIVDAMIKTLLGNKKAMEKAGNYLTYEMGFPF